MEFMALGLLVTLAIGYHLPVSVHTLFESTFLLSCCVFVLIALFLWSSRKGAKWCIAGSVLGLVLLSYQTHQFYLNDFILGQNKRYTIQGEIVNDQFPLTCESQIYCHHTLIVRPSKIDGKSAVNGLFSSLLLLKASMQPNELNKGDVINVTAKLNRPLSYENQYGFNFAKWAFTKGISAKGAVVGDVQILASEPALSQRFLHRLINQLSEYQYSAYFYPLLVAENALLSQEQKTQLQHFGLSHLFAISGLHIGILFVVLNAFIRLSLFWLRHNKTSLIVNLITVVGVWGYVYLIDFPTPSTRAVLLLSIWLLLKHNGLFVTKLWLFCAMTVCTLIFQPTGVLDVGWWLSITAVAGIFVFNHLFQQQTDSDSVFSWSNAKAAAIFQCFIGVWMIPWSLYWFSGVSIAGFWINLLLVPVFCFAVIPCLFTAAGLVALGDTTISGMLFSLVNQLLAFSLSWSDEASKLISWLTLPTPLYALVLALIVTFLWRKVLTTKLLVTLVSASLVLLLLTKTSFEKGQLEVLVVDVGQGTSVLLQRNGKGVLYDLGPIYISGFSATKAAVIPNVTGLGLTKLDRVIISHQDSDHYGDVQAMTPYMSDKMELNCPEQVLQWQNTKLVRLWPPRHETDDKNLSDNDLSCVLKVIDLSSNKSILLTGDIGRVIELKLVEQHQKGEIDLVSNVLFSAHHGSRFSSSFPFLKSIRPELVIHTAGVFNHFGFPTTQVKQRVNAVGAKQFSTSNWGQLSLSFSAKNKQIEVVPRLNWLSPFWKKQNPFSFQVEIR